MEAEEPKTERPDSAPPAAATNPHPPGETGRRAFVKKSLAVLAGTAVVIVPVGAGLMVATDPLRRKGDEAEFIQITTLDALPADGTPQKFQVVADRTDAWNKYRNVPVGAVYVRRLDNGTVQAFNVVCPHAGCFVDVAADGKSFLCPCHNSYFAPDGSVVPGRSVSPRGLDELAVDPEALKQGAVKVKFQNFQAGTHDKVPLT